MTQRNVSPSPTSPTLGFMALWIYGRWWWLMMNILWWQIKKMFFWWLMMKTDHMMISMTGIFSSGFAASPIALATCVPPILQKQIQETQKGKASSQLISSQTHPADKQKVDLPRRMHSWTDVGHNARSTRRRRLSPRYATFPLLDPSPLHVSIYAHWTAESESPEYIIARHIENCGQQTQCAK